MLWLANVAAADCCTPSVLFYNTQFCATLNSVFLSRGGRPWQTP